MNLSKKIFSVVVIVVVFLVLPKAVHDVCVMFSRPAGYYADKFLAEQTMSLDRAAALTGADDDH